MSKRSLFFTALLSFFLVLLPVGSVLAVQISNAVMNRNSQTGYSGILLDQANLLTSSEELELLDEMMKVTDFCTAVFVSSTEEHSGSVVQYARSVMEDVCGSMNLSGYTAIIFLIDMYNRELVIYSGETVFQTITTGVANSITDNTYTYASRGDYLGCAKEAFSQIYRVLDGQKIAQPMRYITAALLAAFVGLAVSLLLVRAKTRRRSADSQAIMDSLLIHEFEPNVTSELISTKKTLHVEVTSGGGGGGFSGGGGGGFSGGGGGGFSGGGGGFSGGGGGGSHSF